MNIPILIPCFNQLTYVRNLVNWFQYYYPNNDIHILDNKSNYQPLLDWYDQNHGNNKINVVRFNLNDARNNLRWFIDEQISKQHEYYAIADPDIMLLPSTPVNFLEIFKHCIESYGYHHAGFSFKINDLPDYIENKQVIINNESGFWTAPITISFEGKNFTGYKAPIDTSFALYRSSAGWESPMRGDWWGNSIRMFEACHIGWYIDPSNVNPEMEHYFKTAIQHTPGKPSAGANNYRPSKFNR